MDRTGERIYRFFHPEEKLHCLLDFDELFYQALDEKQSLNLEGEEPR